MVGRTFGMIEPLCDDNKATEAIPHGQARSIGIIHFRSESQIL
jgi:hypothetical protein